jgi:hypothetical protein
MGWFILGSMLVIAVGAVVLLIDSRSDRSGPPGPPDRY